MSAPLRSLRAVADEPEGHGETAAPRFRPLRRGSKFAETIAQAIVRGISSTGMQAGAQLPAEALMIEEYGVGRASVREALRILEVLGLISIKAGPGGGPVVSAVSTRDFGRIATLYFQVGGMTYREIIEARMIMEPTLAALAASRRDDDPQVLEELLLAAEATETGDDHRYLQSSADFHRLVAKMAGNRILYLFSHSLEDILHDRVTGLLFPLEQRGEVVEAHRGVAQAIVRGQASRARQLMLAHMERYAHFLAERHPALMDEVVDWR